MTDFPSSKYERSKIVAKTGLRVGSNYARYFIKRSLSGKDGPVSLDELHQQNASDIYRELTKLRGTALKLAQALSLDTGMLPEQFVDVMAGAQYSVPPMNRALVRSTIKRELGKYPEQLFRTFSAEAIAAASIGQVHAAELKDGRKVAVKIQYPNVRETIDSDLAVARPIFKRLVSGKHIDEYFVEIREKLLEETDYLHEAEMIDRFATLYQTDRVITPRQVPELTTERVLTMTFVEGQHLSPFLEADPPQERKDHFGQILWDFFHEQIANEQYTIHADVHPGNFLFREDGRVGIIDFGCVKTFPERFLQSFIRLVPAHLSDDAEEILNLYYETDILDPADSDPERNAMFLQFFRDFGETILRPYRSERFDFGDPEFKSELNEHFKLASTFNEVRGSRHYIFLNKVVIGLYALLMKLKPVIDTRYSREILEGAVAKWAEE